MIISIGEKSRDEVKKLKNNYAITGWLAQSICSDLDFILEKCKECNMEGHFLEISGVAAYAKGKLSSYIEDFHT